MKQVLKLGVVAAVAALGLSASPITFTISGAGSGLLNGFEFSNKAFTVTALADTANVVDHHNGVLGVENDSVSIEIADLGIFLFTTHLSSFVAHGGQFAGIANTDGGGADLIHSGANAGLATWDLVTSFGPITGTGDLLGWGLAPVATSGGTLYFSPGNSSITFQASTGSEAPEPGSILLLFSGLGTLGIVGFRNRKA